MTGATVDCDVPMWRVGDHSIGAVACATVDGTTLGAVTGATVDCDVPIRRVRDHSRCCGWCNCTYIDTCLCGGCGTTLDAVAGVPWPTPGGGEGAWQASSPGGGAAYHTPACLHTIF